MEGCQRAGITRPPCRYKEIVRKGKIVPHMSLEHSGHSCALHLLQSGVDIAVIALWLGHESIQATHGYIEGDLAIKEQALQKLAPAGSVH